MSSNLQALRVAVRIRKMVDSETLRGCQSVVKKTPNEPQIIVGQDGSKNPEVFTFNQVYSPDDGQEMIYNTVACDLIDKLFDGYNVTILAYGQTGSGKTYTMGTMYNGEESNDMGLIPRAVKEIYSKMDEMKDRKSFNVTCSFMELYQERLIDLLSEDSQSLVDMREENKNIIIPGLTQKSVNTFKEVVECLIKGSNGRTTGATAMNATSSRSHAIFTITMNVTDCGPNSTNGTISKFHLVDLAGSERSKKTKAVGERFREGVKINQGLLVLGNVISALGAGQQYINYRDSKLTRLLQDSLGGNSVTLMIACISPADYNLDETLSTLRYADRAKKIKNKPIVNQDPMVAEIARLKRIIEEMKQNGFKSVEGVGPGGDDNVKYVLDSSENIALKAQLTCLQEKNLKLQQYLQTALQDVAYNECRAHAAENANEELSGKLAIMKTKFGELNEKLTGESCPIEYAIHSKTIADLFDLLKEADTTLTSKRSEIAEMKNYGDQLTGNNCSVVDDDVLENHNSVQIQFSQKLRLLNNELALKEELQGRYAASVNGDNIPTAETVQDLLEKIQILQKEKEELELKEKSVCRPQTASKLAEERRKRVKELEKLIEEKNRIYMLQSKKLKDLEKDKLRLKAVVQDIESMKREKVKLMRAMRQESDKFRKYKLDREKEVNSLKEKDRKRVNEITRLKIMQEKQSNVLKRKMEAYEAVNKRLKNIIDKQQTARSNKKTDSSWLEEQVEMLLSITDAKTSLEQILEERTELYERLDELKEQSDESTLEQEAIESEIGKRNKQIRELQEKLIKADVDAKIISICEAVNSLADGREILKLLLTQIIDFQKELTQKTYKGDIHEDKIMKLEAELMELKHEYIIKLRSLEQEHRQKILMIKQQNHHDADTDVDKSNLQEYEELLEKYEAVQNENAVLRSLDYKRPAKVSARKTIRDSFEESILPGEDSIIDLDDSNDDPEWTMSVERRTFTRNTRKSEDTSKNVLKKSKLSFDENDKENKCGCTGSKCDTKRCGCKKSNSFCNASCKCLTECMNRENGLKRPSDSLKFEVAAVDDADEHENDDPSAVNQTPKRLKTSTLEDLATPNYPYKSRRTNIIN